MTDSIGKKTARSDLLSGILSDHDNLQREMNSNGVSAEKKQRLEGYRDMFSTIYGILNEVHSKVRSQGIDAATLEVEVRVGMIIYCNRRWRNVISRPEVIPVEDTIRNSLNLTFQPGIDDVQIERLKNVLISEGFSTDVKPICRQRININHDRWEVSHNNVGATMQNIENKTKILSCDLALLSHHYDIRIAAATETVSQKVIDPDSWTTERLKRRITYTRPKLLWKIDLTEVETTARNIPGVVKDIELEFEIHNRLVTTNNQTYKYIYNMI